MSRSANDKLALRLASLPHADRAGEPVPDRNLADPNPRREIPEESGHLQRRPLQQIDREDHD